MRLTADRYWDGNRLELENIGPLFNFQVSPLSLEKIARNWLWSILPLRKSFDSFSLNVPGAYRVRQNVFNRIVRTFSVTLKCESKVGNERNDLKMTKVKKNTLCNSLF